MHKMGRKSVAERKRESRLRKAAEAAAMVENTEAERKRVDRSKKAAVKTPRRDNTSSTIIPEPIPPPSLLTPASDTQRQRSKRMRDADEVQRVAVKRGGERERQEGCRALRLESSGDEGDSEDGTECGKSEEDLRNYIIVLKSRQAAKQRRIRELEKETEELRAENERLRAKPFLRDLKIGRIFTTVSVTCIFFLRCAGVGCEAAAVLFSRLVFALTGYVLPPIGEAKKMAKDILGMFSKKEPHINKVDPDVMAQRKAEKNKEKKENIKEK